MNSRTLAALSAASVIFAIAACSPSRESPPLGSGEALERPSRVGDTWRAAATGGVTPLATWAQREDKDAPGGGPVIALTATNHASGSAFNLYLNDARRFKDGSFTVHFRADAGKTDAGGGPVWRVQDENNYYICRANPLEDNFRLYVVKNGSRRQLATIDAKHSTGMWHAIEVTHTGDKVRCVLDGRASLEATDATIPGEGGVGLWTKSDARTSFVVPAEWRTAAAAPPATPGRALDTAAIESITGLKGALAKDNTGAEVFKLTQGRTDVPITVEGRRMEPFMGFTTWAAFQAGSAKPAIMAGDMVVFPDEVSPAMDALFASGCTVTALHNHFFFEEPKTYFMHFGGEGDGAALAKGFRAALDAVKAVRAKNPHPASAFDEHSAPTEDAITAARLDAIFFPDGKTKGAAQSGMYKATIGRTVKMSCGCQVGNLMGVNTWAGFCGTDDAAAVAGDFITFPGELQPVLRALRAAGIHIVAIHSHMEGDTPTSIFLHYWGKGRAEDLARAVKSALDAQARAAK